MLNTCSSMTGFAESSEIPEASVVDDNLIGENPWQALKIKLIFSYVSFPRSQDSHSGASYLHENGYNLQSSSGLNCFSDPLLVLWNQALICYYGECVYALGRWFPDSYTRVVPSGYVRSQGEQLQFAVVSNCLDLCDDADFYGFFATDAAIVQHLGLCFCLFSFDKQQAVATFGFWLMFVSLKDCFMASPSRSELLVFNVDEHLLLWNDPHVSPAVFCGDMSLFICIWNGLLLKEYCFLSHKDMMAQSLSGVTHILVILSFVAAIMVQRRDSLFACCSHKLEQNFSKLQSRIGVYISQVTALKVVTHYGGLKTLLWFLFGSLSRPPEAQEVTNSSPQAHMDTSLIDKLMEKTHEVLEVQKSKMECTSILRGSIRVYIVGLVLV